MVSNFNLVSDLSKTYRRIVEDKPRQIAFEVFTEVIRNGAYSNLLLPQKLSSSGLDSRDKAFVLRGRQIQQ
jgi:hypothetical protein